MRHYIPQQTRTQGALLVCALLLCCCNSNNRPRPRHNDDPTVNAMDQLLKNAPRRRGRCLSQSEVPAACSSIDKRVIDVTVALDPRYQGWPQWRKRLSSTFGCVNKLYGATRLQWRIARILPWDPGRHRHQLYPLLHRLRHEVPAHKNALRLGITVWEPRKIYHLVGGEIGLSQAGACVVPSWPRTENDCVILAHELGHLVGAKHVPGKHWVMGWAASPFHLPAVDPLARVVATYSFHPRNVRVMDIYASAHITGSGMALSPLCRATIDKIDQCY